jgi:uncharacterized protein YcbX
MNVAQLWRYPVKSMQGEPVQRLRLDGTGAEHDRMWGVVDCANDKVLSAKRTASLLDAAARLDEPSGAVTITLPDGEVYEAGDPRTDKALSTWLGRQVRLVRPGPEATAYELTMDPADDDSEVWDFATPPGSFVDLAAAHLLTTASLAAAAATLPDGQWNVHRFRPTMLIDAGPADGYLEDGWVGQRVTLGGVTVEPFMPTPRCAMPTRGQAIHGLEPDKRISRTLTDQHQNNLGVYCTVTAAGVVAVGDPVEAGPPG